jgi:hypothetical protein
MAGAVKFKMENGKWKMENGNVKCEVQSVEWTEA